MESAGPSAAPPRDGPPNSRVAVLWRRVRELVPYEVSPPFAYTRGLVAYVCGLAGVAVAAGLATIPGNLPHGGTEALVAGAISVCILAGMAVRAINGVNTLWSAAEFIHIGLSLAFGPVGALVASLADGVGTSFRYRLGAFRALFNTADFFLTNVSCWLVFAGTLRIAKPTVGTILLASSLVGLTHWLVNHLPVAGVLRLAVGPDFKIRPFMSEASHVLPYSWGYAYGGYVFLLVRDDGALGITSAVASAALLQGFLIFLEGRTRAYRAAQAEAARIEKELLERAVGASEQERQRIAGELHDGVVQDLVGMSLLLSAGAKVAQDMTPRELRMAELLRQSADVTRAATGDLRTLMIEIAPPRLADEGLPSVLSELVGKVARVGIIPILEVPHDIGLSERASKLIYRVAQEGVRNAIKYSKAKTLTVRVERTDDGVDLTVTDDGIGFTSQKREQRRHEGHMGLNLLTQTVKDGGGALTIESVPGHGTTMTMVLKGDVTATEAAPK